MLEHFYVLSNLSTEDLNSDSVQENLSSTKVWLYDLTLTSNPYVSFNHGSLRVESEMGSKDCPIVLEDDVSSFTQSN